MGVATLSATNAWASGWFENNAQTALLPIILHWNGRAWSIVASPNRPAKSTAFDVLLGVTVSGPTSLWSVGGFDNQVQGNPGERTMTLHNTQG